MKFLSLSLATAAGGVLLLLAPGPCFGLNSLVQLLGNPGAEWTDFTTPPFNTGSTDLTPTTPGTGSIMGFDPSGNGRGVSYNSENFRVDFENGYFRLEGTFLLGDDDDDLTYIAGFASGSLTSFSEHFQRLHIDYQAFAPPGDEYQASWVYRGTTPGGATLGSAGGSFGDTVSYVLTANHHGGGNWGLAGSITVGSNTLWDSTVTPMLYSTDALIARDSHFMVGVDTFGATNVSVSGGSFTAAIPEPTRVLLATLGLAGSVLVRRRIK